MNSSYTGIGAERDPLGGDTHFFNTTLMLSDSDVDILSSHKITDVRIRYLGGTTDIKFSFADLTPNNSYLLLVTAMDGDNQMPLNYKKEGKKITYYKKYVYQMTESSGLQSVKLDQADAEVYDIRGVRQGKASDIKSLPKGIYIINKKKVINN